MAKPTHIELTSDVVVPVLYEDRSVLAIDKPSGWLLVPAGWDRTSRNLQLALESGIQAGAFWARVRDLEFIRFVHRLDGDTSGVLLLAKSRGALRAYSQLFEARQVGKTYWAVVYGRPPRGSWVCRLPLSPDANRHGLVRVDPRHGRDAETHFSVLSRAADRSLVEARPVTGRTHQIRVHLSAGGFPVWGDALYGPERVEAKSRHARDGRRAAPPTLAGPLGLRAVRLSYRDPFHQRSVIIEAPGGRFLRSFGFEEGVLLRS